ncbi:hypothetical protein [Mycolicibacterium porcinum]|uniref:HNH endonuclease n=1 Tax=Mycolicibacterium porcinum TaxID=39693 RepID=A0AAW5TDA6_9MYCO|nr:hypothetical protein [Mycolicibacterium porcinum]MCV7392528.1 hypothetical protein [Mycolicibacterium porcinum]
MTHPESWSLDHKLPVKERPELIPDRNNWAGAHWSCNHDRGYSMELNIGPGALGAE